MSQIKGGASPKSHPILFSPLVNGTKTQTRRIIAPQPEKLLEGEPYWNIGGFRLRPMLIDNPLRCPYGNKGSLLWVREAWRVIKDTTPSTRAGLWPLLAAIWPAASITPAPHLTRSG
jgi:hypothetical protein